MTDAILIRPATTADAPALAGLIGELGYPIEAAVAEERLAAATATGDLLLVAEAAGQVIGLLHLHRTPFLHRPPDGRVSTLVVTEAYRSAGLGARLLAAAEETCRAWGCTRVEVSSGAARAAAHRFYERAGYTEQPKRFIKVLLTLALWASVSCCPSPAKAATAVLLTMAHTGAADLGFIELLLEGIVFGIPLTGLLHLLTRTRRGGWSIALAGLNAMLGTALMGLGSGVITFIGMALLGLAVGLSYAKLPTPPTP